MVMISLIVKFIPLIFFDLNFFLFLLLWKFITYIKTSSMLVPISKAYPAKLVIAAAGHVVTSLIFKDRLFTRRTRLCVFTDPFSI